MNGNRRSRYDEVHLETHQLGCVLREPFRVDLCGWVDEGNVLPIHIAKLAEPLAECLPEVHALRDRARRKDADPRAFSRLLRVYGERHREKAECKGGDDDVASAHLNT